MAEEAARARQYAYSANANLVLESSRTDRRRRKNEGTGEVESLDRDNMPYKMGDKVSKRSNTHPTNTSLPATKKQRTKETNSMIFSAPKGSTVLGDVSSSSYTPSNATSRAAYDQILARVSSTLGSQPSGIITSAAEEVVEILRSSQDTLPDSEKPLEVSKILPNLSSTDYTFLLSNAKALDDFAEDNNITSTTEELDTEMGVAVVFDKSDEEEEEEEEEDSDTSEEEESTEVVVVQSEEEEEEEDVKLVSAKVIDAFWLQRQVSSYYPNDAETSSSISESIFEILSQHKSDISLCESKLVALLSFDKFDLIKLLLDNRFAIYFATRYQRESDKESIINEMKESEEGRVVLNQLLVSPSEKDITNNLPKKTEKKQELVTENNNQRVLLDVESLTFSNHLMTNTECHLPQGTWRASKKGYEEVHVPAVKSHFSETDAAALINIAESLPSWTHDAFNGMTTLNRVQSKMYDAAFKSSENLLLCAPTGAGKTNVALLTILHEIAKARTMNNEVDLSSFKIVYVAPMKALVQEVVANLSQRLASLHISVAELSGDASLTREQILGTQIIVTTPEKWDIITRKSSCERSYTSLVKLVIFDEIHLLHDGRGPVLECIVARTIRQIESTQEMVRLVGLSATLPNYEDVATFLRVDPSKGLFFFDSSFRPVPLQGQYIGILEKKGIKRLRLMNEICYEKVMIAAKESNQVLVFVHSRKETGSTAAALRDMALANDSLSTLLKEKSASSEILATEASNVKDKVLKDVLPFGFGIHHAGMTRSDRTLVEELFADGHLSVLCSTATLAWGVNLPAHTVIIKGTQVYNPEEGNFTELSPLDVMQMLGRAGRVQFDTQGEGIIITAHSELKFYLSLMNVQLPVESQMLRSLSDCLNAEIVLGSVSNLNDAAAWLGYTYLYVRMLKNPATYGIPVSEIQNDPTLLERRLNLCHSAAVLLAKHHLVTYDRRSGSLRVTDLGRVASHYYIVHQSVKTYNEFLSPNMSEIEILRLFSMSHEFRHVNVRSEEKLELASMLERVPVPIKESVEEPSAKVNVLLQAYISHLSLSGFALVADMVHISQSAARILRALFEIALTRQWASLSEKLLSLCKMVDKRMWASQTPLRQFKDLKNVWRKIEKKDLSFDRYFDLSKADLVQLLGGGGANRDATAVYKALHSFPRLEVSAHVQPITRSVLSVDLCITPDYERNDSDSTEGFWILVTDVDGKSILHREWFVLRRRQRRSSTLEEHVVSFTLPIFDPVPPLYYIRLLSDKWIACEFTLPISFHSLVLPSKNLLPTELLDLQPHILSSDLASYFPDHERVLNPIQTQAFPRLFKTSDNMFISAPVGSGKLQLAELAILKVLSEKVDQSRILFVANSSSSSSSGGQKYLKQLAIKWQQKFEGLTVSIVKDASSSTINNISLTTFEAFEGLSRKKAVMLGLDLVILFDLHLVSVGMAGVTYETGVSRLRYLLSTSSAAATNVRMIGFADSIANASDVAEWMGASSHSLAFHPSSRPTPLDVYVMGFETPNFSNRMLGMAKPAFHAVSESNSAIVFVPSGTQCQLLAIDFVTFSLTNSNTKFTSPEMNEDDFDESLAYTVEKGVGYIQRNTSSKVVSKLVRMYEEGRISVLIMEYCLVTEFNEIRAPRSCSSVTIVYGTQYYDGREYRYVNYPMHLVNRMLGVVSNTSKAIVMSIASRKEFLKKFCQSPLPIESHLDHGLSDILNVEVTSKRVSSKQEAVDFLTWSFLYRRLLKNPNYYNMSGSSHEHVSDYMSELVESTVSNLVESRCIAEDDDDDSLSPLNLGMIASYYSITYTTIERMASLLTSSSKLKTVLHTLCASSEFESLVDIRAGDESWCKSVAKHSKLSITSSNDAYNTSAIKVNLLLQSHFSQTRLKTAALAKDLEMILPKAVTLSHAMVDVISSNGWLSPALAVMDLCQMIRTGVWSSDSPLLAIPFITPTIVSRIQEIDSSVETPLDLLSMEDEDREKALQITDEKTLSVVASYCNSYPDVVIQVDVSKEIYAGEVASVSVCIKREEEPEESTEQYWVVVGDVATNTLLSIKRTSVLGMEKTVKLQWNAPEEEGNYHYSLYLICDSYVGCDLENEIEIVVKESEEDL